MFTKKYSSMSDKTKLKSALEDLLAGADVDEVPEGWKTAQEWADLMGLARNTVTARIANKIRDGLWELKKFRVYHENANKVYPTPHYRKKQ